MTTIDREGKLHAGDGKYTNKPQAGAGFDLASPDPNHISGPERLDEYASLGVPAGLACAIPDGYDETLLPLLECDPDRESRRERVIQFCEWHTASQTGHISRERAARLVSEAETAAKVARTARDAASARRPLDLDQVREAERDMWDSWRRYKIARDDLLVLRGGEPYEDSAHARVADRNYRGQVMPYPDENIRGYETDWVSEMTFGESDCEACDGRGQVNYLDGGLTKTRPCVICEGTGKVDRR